MVVLPSVYREGVKILRAVDVRLETNNMFDLRHLSMMLVGDDRDALLASLLHLLDHRYFGQVFDHAIFGGLANEAVPTIAKVINLGIHRGSSGQEHFTGERLARYRPPMHWQVELHIEFAMMGRQWHGINAQMQGVMRAFEELDWTLTMETMLRVADVHARIRGQGLEAKAASKYSQEHRDVLKAVLDAPMTPHTAAGFLRCVHSSKGLTSEAVAIFKKFIPEDLWVQMNERYDIDNLPLGSREQAILWEAIERSIDDQGLQPFIPVPGQSGLEPALSFGAQGRTHLEPVLTDLTPPQVNSARLRDAYLITPRRHDVLDHRDGGPARRAV